MDFALALSTAVGRYSLEVAGKDEHLALLRWQMGQGHRLDLRETMPGHVVTSAFVVTPDHSEILLIDHITQGRWLQPGGHYEPSAAFYESALRELVEETGVTYARLHPWHKGQDLPFTIDSHDAIGKPARGEPVHVHHDLQFLFVAEKGGVIEPQEDEVYAARWFPISVFESLSPRAASRLKDVTPLV